ncbi:MAG TPA: glycosyltransferase family 4 protein [Vicinamibacterales bacterium]|nr:glycosyltransferase family 4 protein [Vicinamibacterales bacterium]
MPVITKPGRPIRVALLTTYYHPIIGGVESHTRQVAAELQRRGFDVVVVTRRLEATIEQPEMLEGVTMNRVGPRGGRTRFAKWFLVPFALRALFRMRPRPDVIFCPDFRGIGLAALAAGRMLRRPVVLQAETPGALSCSSWDTDLARAGISSDGWVARQLKRPLRRAYASATMYNCISREIEDEALSCGVQASRLARIPHGVDVDRFRPASPEERDRERASRGWPADGLLCLFLGRLSVEKGILDLLEAWTHVDEAMLVVVGPDMPGHPLDAGPEARSFVERRGLGGRVLFAGPASDPAPLLKAADVFVQPSHYEAFGISAIEALASGLPVVATRTGGLAGFLAHEDNALLCAPGSPSELAREVNRLLQDPELRQTLGARGRDTAVRSFDKNVVADSYARLFRTLAGPRSP